MKKALVVGVDDYPYAALHGCVDDAKAMASVLEVHGDEERNFDVELLTSPSTQLKKPRLRGAIEKLFQGDCEIALFYFSGHGLIKSTGGYIVTTDVQKYDEGIAMDEILALANQSKAKNRIVILDCCHAGALGTPQIAAANVAQLSEGLTILAASREDEPAMQVNGSSIFTELVVDALRGGAADLGGHVTPGAVYSYVDRALGAWDQRPVFKTNVTQFISLRHVPAPVPLAILRKLPEYFSGATDEHGLDPTYEETSGVSSPTKAAVFKELQKMERVGLIVPVGEDHMYYAAMNSKSCLLTALGRHYWRLANEKKL